MRRSAPFLALCCVFAGPLLPNAYSQAPTRPKRVLVLYWYPEQSPFNVAIDRGFRSVLRSERAFNVEYYAEYLESNQFAGKRQEQLLHDYLQSKYEALPIDVVVASAGASHAFLLAHRQTLFPNAPLVFLAGSHLYAAAPTGPGSTGIGAYRDFRKRLDLALRLHPGTNHVFIISGSLDGDRRFERVAREELRGYDPEVAVTYLTDLSLHELVANVKKLPRQSVLLFAWQQFRNEQGSVLEPADILGAIGELTGTLAHEVVQPLSAILINAHAARRLLERESVDREELQGALDDIVNADERATEVLGRVAQALRKKDSAREELNLNDVVGDTLKLSAATQRPWPGAHNQPHDYRCPSRAIWAEGNDGYGATFAFCIPALPRHKGNGRADVAAGDAA